MDTSIDYKELYKKIESKDYINKVIKYLDFCIERKITDRDIIKYRELKESKNKISETDKKWLEQNKSLYNKCIKLQKDIYKGFTADELFALNILAIKSQELLKGGDQNEF